MFLASYLRRHVTSSGQDLVAAASPAPIGSAQALGPFTDHRFADWLRSDPFTLNCHSYSGGGGTARAAGAPRVGTTLDLQRAGAGPSSRALMSRLLSLPLKCKNLLFGKCLLGLHNDRKNQQRGLKQLRINKHAQGDVPGRLRQREVMGTDVFTGSLPPGRCPCWAAARGTRFYPPPPGLILLLFPAFQPSVPQTVCEEGPAFSNV